MLVENKVQGWTVVDDHIIGGEVGFGDMTSIRSAEYQDLVITSADIKMASMYKLLDIHGISHWRKGWTAFPG